MRKLTGNWTPGGFDVWITLAAKLILCSSMMVRGIDYYTGDSVDNARRLSTIEAAAPLWFWGILFIAGAVLGFTSMFFKWGNGVMWSHSIGAVGYFALASGLGADVIERSEQSTGAMITLLIIAFTGLMLGVWAATFAVKGVYRPLIVATTVVSLSIGVMSVHFDGLRNVTIFVCLAVLHLLMVIGTASRMRQNKVLEARYA